MLRPIRAAALVLLFLLSPAVAQAPSAVGDALWEDALLLDAARYLRLSPGQVRQILPLSESARERLRRGDDSVARTREALRKLVDRQRNRLVRGSMPTATEQEQALFARRTLLDARAREVDDALDLLAPRLAGLMEGPQLRRALLLARGDWPRNVLESPGLLAPESGFVVGTEEQNRWRDSTLRRALATEFPRPLANAVPLSSGRFQFVALSTDYLSVRAGALGLKLVDAVVDPRSSAEDAAREEARLRLREQGELLRRRPDLLASAVVDGAREPELAGLLEPLVRRLLGSERLRPALLARLGRDVPSPASDPAVRFEHEWEETLLLACVRYLRLTEEQLPRLLLLAEAADERRAALARRLEPVARGAASDASAQRNWLLLARPVPAPEQQKVLAVRRRLRDEAAGQADRTAAEMAPTFLSMLDRDQRIRALLLLLGSWPSTEVRAPLLLDPPSGFVLGDGERRSPWMERALGEALPGYGPQVPTEYVTALKLNGTADLVLGFRVSRWIQPDRPDGDPLTRRFPPLLVEAARRRAGELGDRWDRLPDLLLEGASPYERALAARPLARRILFSPRLDAAFKSRLESGAGLPEPDEVPVPPSEPGLE